VAITSNKRFFPRCYGSELTPRDLDFWAYANNITLDFSRPGKPMDYRIIGPFNGKLGAACLNAHWFMNLADAYEPMTISLYWRFWRRPSHTPWYSRLA
jgi:putative transposase